MTESLEEEAHGAAALTEEVVDAIANLKIVEYKNVGLEVSICLDMFSIETFGLDSSKNDISTVQKSRQFKKRHLDRPKVSTVQKTTS